MSKHALSPLWGALRFNRHEFFQLDLYLGVAGGAGGLILAILAPDALLRTVPVAAVMLGVIVGAVIAGVAILAAFMDQAFLRKLAAINRAPVRYLGPFLFTAVLGVFAMIFIIALSATSSSSPLAVLAFLGCVSGFLSIWAIASLLPCLSMLVQFMGLKTDALGLPDEEDRSQGAAAK
jgi:NAD/NADP transhydrogenase beta subunit